MATMHHRLGHLGALGPRDHRTLQIMRMIEEMGLLADDLPMLILSLMAWQCSCTVGVGRHRAVGF